MVRPEHVTHRGVEGGAALVVEIRSPGDETDAKVPFYERFGVEQLLIVDRDSAALRLLRCGSGLVAVPADDTGWVDSSLDVAFRPAPGNVLGVRLPGGQLDRC